MLTMQRISTHSFRLYDEDTQEDLILMVELTRVVLLLPVGTDLLPLALMPLDAPLAAEEVMQAREVKALARLGVGMISAVVDGAMTWDEVLEAYDGQEYTGAPARPVMEDVRDPGVVDAFEAAGTRATHPADALLYTALVTALEARRLRVHPHEPAQA